MLGGLLMVSYSVQRIRCFAFAALAPLCATAARADVTVTSTLRMKGGNRDQKAVVTTYYRGNLVRSETGDGIRIADSKTGMVTILSKKNGTYRTMRLADVFAKIGQSGKRQMRFSANISPRGQRKSLLSRSVQRYTGTGTLSILASRPGAVEQPVMKVLIDQWAAPSIRIPSSSIALSLSGMPGLGGGLAANRDLAREMGKIKGLPMVSHFEMIPQSPSGSRVVADSQVTRIVEGTLSPSLFRVPKGYRKILPRSARSAALP
jgi:hypothetical protein